jgi:ATP-dependent helicase IRC3
LAKTLVFTEIARRLDLQGRDVVVVIAHSGELLEQAEEKFRAVMPGAWIGTEKAAAEASAFSRVIVASVQTLKGPRLDSFMRTFAGRIRALIIDEAHRAAATSYKAIVKRVLDSRPDAFVLGVTATPRRGDRLGLGVVFTKIAYSLDLRTAIERGYLVPIRGFRVDTETSLDKVATRAGDFVREQVALAVNHPVRNRLMVDAYRKIAPHSKTVVFTVDVEHARAVCEEFKAAGFAAEYAHGEMSRDARRAIVDRFRRGETRVLVNCALFLEGFDVADIETIMLGRPARSPVVVTQATGRGTRPHPSVAALLGGMTSDEERCRAIAASQKPYVNVIDLVDASKRHQLVTLPTLFGLSPGSQGARRAVVGRSTFEVLPLDHHEQEPPDHSAFDGVEATFEERHARCAAGAA